MKKIEFTECPICNGRLKKQSNLDHPIKGKIFNIPHHICLRCGEIFLDGEFFDIVHFYGHKQKAAA